MEGPAAGTPPPLASGLTDPDGELTLAHVHRGELTEELKDSLELLERERIGIGVEAELVSILSTSPGRGLDRQAERQGADLPVVGSCRRVALGRVMLDDDTREAMDGAPCAVAIAFHGYAEHPDPIAKAGVGWGYRARSIDILGLPV